MRVAVIHAPTSHFSVLMCGLTRGIEAAGDEVVQTAVGHGKIEADAAVCWGWRRAKIIRRSNPMLPVLVMERGYVGDRFHWTSLGWNGLNGRAIFPKPDMQKRGRDGLLVIPKPWRWQKGFLARAEGQKEPGYALILGQVQNDQACINVNLAYQYRHWATVLQRQGWKVRLRPHPKARRQAYGMHSGYYTRGTLEEDLAGAAFTVSWNSNASVDSVLAGVPSVTLDEGSMAWGVTSHDLANPVTMPSRTDWAAQLAWCQWQPAELVDGSAWRAVREVKP